MPTKKPCPASPNTAFTRKGWKQPPCYEPTAGELRQRIAEVQGRWSESERQRRLVTPPPPPIEVAEFVLPVGTLPDVFRNL